VATEQTGRRFDPEGNAERRVRHSRRNRGRRIGVQRTPGHGPLLRLIIAVQGKPVLPNDASSTRTTRADGSEVSTSMARHSRVNGS
jgi:hypothetical protein